MTKILPVAWTAGPLRRAGNIDPAGSNGRIIRYRLSDPSVGRDGHRIAADAWVVSNYLANPVVLWAHDTGEPPIGRMVELGTVGDRLMGSVEYPDADAYPFADTIYRLVKGGYLNATSTSWIPLEWKFSQDRQRVGGIDFSRVELLEVSQVPVPALPTALVAARDAGIDTGPLYAWAERVLDTRGDDPELIALRKAARMPTPKKRYTNSNPSDDLIPDTVVSPITALVRKVEESSASAPPAMERGLYTAAFFLLLLDDLYGLVRAVAQEEAGEGDPSPAPAAILAAANDLAQAVLGYVSEQVSEEAAGDDLDMARMMAASPVERRSMLPALFRSLEEKPAVGVPIVRISSDAARIVSAALDRAGRVLSAESEADVRASIDHLTLAAETLRMLLERATPPAPEQAQIEEPNLDVLEIARARGLEELSRLNERQATAQPPPTNGAADPTQPASAGFLLPAA